MSNPALVVGRFLDLLAWNPLAGAADACVAGFIRG
jgi:hypothetical protein